jgi:hypothetical protein
VLGKGEGTIDTSEKGSHHIGSFVICYKPGEANMQPPFPIKLAFDKDIQRDFKAEKTQRLRKRSDDCLPLTTINTVHRPNNAWTILNIASDTPRPCIFVHNFARSRVPYAALIFRKTECADRSISSRRKSPLRRLAGIFMFLICTFPSGQQLLG